MDDLKRALAACMEEYDREIRQAVSQLRPGDGFMGLGRDHRREPCHLRFYESAGALVDRAVREGLAPEAAAETARFLLTLSQAEEYHELTAPMREAAQGHVLALTELLPPETAAELVEWYRGKYRRSQRLPVQKKVLAALERRGKGA